MIIFISNSNKLLVVNSSRIRFYDEEIGLVVRRSDRQALIALKQGTVPLKTGNCP